MLNPAVVMMNISGCFRTKRDLMTSNIPSPWAWNSSMMPQWVQTIVRSVVEDSGFIMPPFIS